jgi:hypothetical protein
MLMVLATSRGLLGWISTSPPSAGQSGPAVSLWRWAACVLVAAAILPLAIPADSNADTTSYLQLKNRATGLCLSTYATRNPSPVFQKPCGSGWETRWATCDAGGGPPALGTCIGSGLHTAGLFNAYSGLCVRTQYNGSGLELWAASCDVRNRYWPKRIGNESWPRWFWIWNGDDDVCVSVDSFASFDPAFEWYCLAQDYDAQTWQYAP